MSQNIEYQRSNVEAGVVAMENLLADGSREDAIFVLGRIRHVLDVMEGNDFIPVAAESFLDNAREGMERADREMNQVRNPLTEADFPEIGPFNTDELSKMLASLTIRGDAEQDYPPTDPEKVRHVDIGTSLDNLTAERGV